MKSFIVNLFSNRFGIVLATLNVCYFASRGNHVACTALGKIYVSVNAPAAISAILSREFVKIFSHPLSFAAEDNLANAFFAVFIVLQWLFIAWIARTLAAKIRRAKLQ